MAQRSSPILPITSGIGAVSPVNVGGPGSAEEAFRNQQGVLQRLLSGIGSGNNVSLEDLARSQFANRQDLATGLESAGSSRLSPGQSIDITGQSNQILPPGFTLTDLTPMPGSIGMSEIPASGAPDVSPSFITTDESDTFSILSPRGRESLDEFLGMFAPNPERRGKIAARAQGLDPDIGPGGLDFDMPNMDAEAQRQAGELREKVEAERAGQPADLSGESVSMTTPTSKPAKPTAVAGTEDNPVKAATVTALDEYLKNARPGVAPDSYDKYIEEFQKATGLDVSGQPDKSTALMAFGLALMQNKAGKGFDVGEMLSAVGGAGEKALPELTAARKEARAIRAKAGEYALSRRKEDQAAAMNRTPVFVVPRTGEGKTEKEKLQNRLMKGRYINVNSYELDALANAEGFDQNFEIMPGDVLSQMDNLFKAPESKYSDKITKFSLFAGAEDAFKVDTYAPKADFADQPSKAISSTEITRAEGAIQNGLEKLDSLDRKFSQFTTAFSETPPTFFNQIGSDVFQFAQSLGIGVPNDFEELSKLEDNVAYQKRFTEYLATRYAPQILQEAGKTISDADRQRVQAIVGEIGKLKSPAGVAARMKELHEFIVLAGRKNMETAIVNLSRVGGTLETPPLSKEEEARYNQLVAKYQASPAPEKEEKTEDE